MSVQEQLKHDQIASMRSKDKATLNAIRSVQTEVATAKSAPGFTGTVDDAFYTKTIAAYVKKISKSRAEYVALGKRGADHVAGLTFEIDYLEQFLPTTLDEGSTRALVNVTIADMGADSDTQVGKVIGAVMRSGKSLDGALVNRIVREELSS